MRKKNSAKAEDGETTSATKAGSRKQGADQAKARPQSRGKAKSRPPSKSSKKPARRTSEKEQESSTASRSKAGTEGSEDAAAEAPLSREVIRQRIRALQGEVYELVRQVGRRSARSPLQGQVEVLVCGLEGNRLGLPLQVTEEVVPFARLTPFPEAPAWVPGLLNLRGEAFPVLDVAARIHRSPRQAELSDLIVIGVLHGRKLGLVVHSVLGIESFPASELAPPPADLPHAPYLTGMRSGTDEPTLVIDVAALVELSDLPEVES